MSATVNQVQAAIVISDEKNEWAEHFDEVLLLLIVVNKTENKAKSKYFIF
jgi:Ca2+-binding EF-hand superfamily protein